MQTHTHTALFTTVSGVIGGLGKVITARPLLMEITFPGLSSVIIYAAVSAIVGYLVKKIMDAASSKLNQFLNKKS